MDGFVMDEVLSDISQLAERINQSHEAHEYARAHQAMKHDIQAQKLIRRFRIIKDEYEEAQRFGIFHPNYHETKEKAKQFQQSMEQHPTIAAFYHAERQLDYLLHQVSLMLAQSVSDSIKVPSNENLTRKGKTFCKS